MTVTLLLAVICTLSAAAVAVAAAGKRRGERRRPAVPAAPAPPSAADLEAWHARYQEGLDAGLERPEAVILADTAEDRYLPTPRGAVFAKYLLPARYAEPVHRLVADQEFGSDPTRL